MASSGSFTTTSCEGRSLTFNWSVKSQSIANNQTTINWSLVGSGSYTYGWVTCGNFKVIIDGKQAYYSSTRINVYSGTVVASGTYTFTHASNGTKSFSASAEAGIYYVAVNCSGSGSWSLPTINRQATITTAPNFNDEANPTIYYNNPAGTAVSSLQACISLTGAVADVPYRNISTTGTSYTFNLTAAERNTLRQNTSGKTRTVYFVVKTVINGTTLTNSKQVTFSIINGNPTIASLTYQDSKASTVAITGNNQQIIQNQSTLQLNIGTVAALKYATINKVEYSINGYTVDITNSYTSPVAVGTINYSTNFNLNVTVTDSRGFTTTKTVTVTMLAWKLPYALINLARQSNFYTATDMLVNAYFSSVDSKNSVTIQYKYKKTTDSTYSSPVTIQNNTETTANFDNQYDFDVQFIVSDLFGSTTYNMVLAKGIPLMFWDIGLNSVGINCFPVNANSLETNGTKMAAISDVPTTLAALNDDTTHRTVSDTEKSTWNGKQETLVSGTNIKTINNESILGSGNISVGGGGSATDVQINGTSIVSNNTANLATEGTYNETTNKIATMSDVSSAVSSKAPIASPTFTGTPTAPTAAAGTNTTQIATTAFVQNAINNDSSWLELSSSDNVWYRKVNGIVYVRCYATPGTTYIGGGSYTILATLPEGYRPTFDIPFVFHGIGGDVSNQSAFIYSTGGIALYLPGGKTTNYYSFSVCYPV